jgi:aryl-alcohol dehydrogenase-like predicted oxidoreductase
LGVTAWSPLGGGILTGKYTESTDRGPRRLSGIDGTKLDIARTVFDVATDLGVASSQVALAWLRSRGGIIPILGARTTAQLADNLAGLDLTLPEQQLARLDAASAVPLGFPHDFLASQDFIHDGQRDRLVLPPHRFEFGR